MIFTPGNASAQPLTPNQTHGFGNRSLVIFTYLQNYACVDEPTMDLDFNGVKAQSDPNEMQTPICQPITEPAADPTGRDLTETAHLYVLIPMFSVDNDQNPNDAMPCPTGGRPGELCGPVLGAALIRAFGFVPEAWKTKVNPAITTQCPDPNNAMAGTCTMHASSVDLSKTLVALGKSPGPPTAPVFVPTPNHSHVIDDDLVNTKAIWWEVRPVLVMQQSDWPTADGSSGITSSGAMDDAEAAGRAIEVGSNFFLFFSSTDGLARLSHVALGTYDGNYVSADNCGGDSVNGNATSAGSCTTFTLIDLNGGSLMDGDQVRLQAPNGDYVVAESGGCGDRSFPVSSCRVNANRTSPAAWETFTIHTVNCSGCAIASGDHVSLSSYYGYYVSAEYGGGNGCGGCNPPLNANRSSVGHWEQYVLTFQP
jgi:hypothetical protein